MWRWYDGHQWTGHIHGEVKTEIASVATSATSPAASTQQSLAVTPKKPFLPSFLSWPVVVAALPALGFMGVVAVTAPPAFLLGFVPLLIVGPVLLWIDRTEPEPRSARIHTFLWGAFVAGIVSVIVNSTVVIFFGEAVSAVASAPIIEEITKGLAIVWMVKRREVDGPIDGIVYAGWSAMGFAMIENMSFFQVAFDGDMLVEVFVGRALLTPFAHPLFTMWTGLAIGLAVRARQSPWKGLWGLALAMALHAAWNGAITVGEVLEGGFVITLVVIVLFISLFVASGIGIAKLQRRDELRYQQLTPFLASRYAMDQGRVSVLLDRKARANARSTITNKVERQRFMMEASAMLRLAALFDHDQSPDPADEGRLYSQLVSAANG